MQRISMAKKEKIQNCVDRQMNLDNHTKTVVYSKGESYFGFNFHPWRSFAEFFLPVTEEGTYQVILSTDDYCFGGQGRIWHQTYETVWENGRMGIRLYLPSRTAVVLKKV